MHVLAIMTDEGWRPGPGDPGPAGQAIVLCYVMAALLCAVAAMRNRAGSHQACHRLTDRFWFVMSGAIFALGAIKQFDLGSLLTSLGRHVASSEGWYDGRPLVQAVTILAVMLLGIVALHAMIRRLRPESRSTAMAAGGVAFLVIFVTVRAVSLHQVDEVLGWTLFGAQLNRVFEMIGLAWVGLAACGGLRSRRGSRAAASSVVEQRETASSI